jgi:hypothetical protein
VRLTTIAGFATGFEYFFIIHLLEMPKESGMLIWHTLPLRGFNPRRA